MSQEKWMQYAVKIQATIQEMFDEENEYHIDLKELSKDDNLTDYFHALANVVPAMIFNKLTNNDKNYLEFNHLANQLCFQFLSKNQAD